MVDSFPVQICIDMNDHAEPERAQGERQRRGSTYPHAVARIVHDELRDIGEPPRRGCPYCVMQRTEEQIAGLESRPDEDHLRRRKQCDQVGDGDPKRLPGLEQAGRISRCLG